MGTAKAGVWVTGILYRHAGEVVMVAQRLVDIANV